MDEHFVSLVASSVAVLLGLVLGWFISHPLNWILSGFFLVSTSAFARRRELYTRDRRHACCASR